MENSQKISNGGFHIIGLMVAELIVSMVVLTLGIRIGFGTTIALFMLSFAVILYVVPKLHMPKLHTPISVLPKTTIRKPHIKAISIKSSPRSVAV